MVPIVELERRSDRAQPYVVSLTIVDISGCDSQVSGAYCTVERRDDLHIGAHHGDNSRRAHARAVKCTWRLSYASQRAVVGCGNSVRAGPASVPRSGSYRGHVGLDRAIPSVALP